MTTTAPAPDSNELLVAGVLLGALSIAAGVGAWALGKPSEPKTLLIFTANGDELESPPQTERVPRIWAEEDPAMLEARLAKEKAERLASPEWAEFLLWQQKMAPAAARANKRALAIEKMENAASDARWKKAEGGSLTKRESALVKRVFGE